MLRIVISATLVCCVIFCSNKAIAGADPRACLDLRTDPQGPLLDQDTDNLLHRQLLFKRAGSNYHVDTFSDMAVSGQENCFRWEILNSSGTPDLSIDELTWPSGDIRVSHFVPGVREFNNLRDRVSAKNDSNPVYAFENENKPTQSWIVVKSDTEENDNQGKTAKYTFQRTGELLPKLNADKSILDSPVTTISFGEGRPPPGEIMQTVGSGDVGLQLNSNVEVVGENIVISNIVNATSKGDSEKIRFGLPTMRALQKIKPRTVGDLDDATQFLEAFGGYSKALEDFGQHEWKFVTEVPALGDGGRVFRVRQPVIISTDNSRHCYLVLVYSPIPVGMTLQNCW
jgi:hypothetical protein